MEDTLLDDACLRRLCISLRRGVLCFYSFSKFAATGEKSSLPGHLIMKGSGYRFNFETKAISDWTKSKGKRHHTRELYSTIYTDHMYCR